MAFEAKVVQIAAKTSTGTQAYTGVGFVPKCIIFFGVGSAGGAEANLIPLLHHLGIATGAAEEYGFTGQAQDANTTSDARSKAVAGCLILDATVSGGDTWQANLVSFDADGFTLDWTDAAMSGKLIFCLCLGGSDLTNAKLVTWTLPTSTGLKAVTGVGFEPDLVMHFSINGGAIPTALLDDLFWSIGAMDWQGGQWALSVFSKDNAAATLAQRFQKTDKCLITQLNTGALDSEGSFESMDSGGFTVDFTKAAAVANTVVSLCLKGPNVKVGKFDRTAGTSNESVTGVGLRPEALLVASFGETANAAQRSDVRYALGAATTPTDERSIAIFDDHAADPTVANSAYAEKVMMSKVAPNAMTGRGELVSFDDGGFTYDPVDGAAAEWLYLVMGANVAPNAPTLVSPSTGATVDFLLAADRLFDWTFSDPDAGDTQSAWAFRRKISGAGSYEYWNVGTTSWQAGEVWNAGADGDYTFPAASWDNGTIYNWSVATKDQAALVGPYASDFTVTGSDPPTVTLIGPPATVTTTSRPAAEWTFSDPEGDAQRSYHVRLFTPAQYNDPGFDPNDTGLFPPVVDSTDTLSSGARSWTPGADLTNGATYRYYVRVSSAGGDMYSGWSFTTFTMSLDTPAAPTLTATADNANGRVILALQARDNLLDANEASIETDATGWVADLNQAATYPQRSTLEAANGSASLLMRSGASGDMRVRGTPRKAVTAGSQYTALASFREQTATRNVRVLIRWYDALAAGSLVGTTTGTDIAEAGGAFTQVSATAVAPVGATHAEAVLEVLATGAANEDHYADKMSLAPGASTDWSRGGLLGDVEMIVEYSDDGMTWATVRGADAITLDADQAATVYDYESPPGVSRSYRAKSSSEV